MGIGMFDTQDPAKAPNAAVCNLDLPSGLVEKEDETMRRCGLISSLLFAQNKRRALKITSEEWKKFADQSAVAARKAKAVYASTLKDQFIEKERFLREIEDSKMSKEYNYSVGSMAAAVAKGSKGFPPSRGGAKSTKAPATDETAAASAMQKTNRVNGFSRR